MIPVNKTSCVFVSLNPPKYLTHAYVFSNFMSAMPD